MRSVVPIAWSRDGSRVAYLSGDDPTNPYSGQRLAGDLVVLDLASGNATPVPGDRQAWAAAFSPDGDQLAVQRASGGASGDLSILDLSEGTVRPLTIRGVLAGPAAWSPDGRLLAVSGSSGLSFVDPLGSGPASATHLTVEGPRLVLGWTGAREVATFETDFDVARLVAHSLDGSKSRELTSIGNQGSYGVGTFQLASALVADVQVRAAGGPDRGPLPPVFRFTLATVVGLAVAGLVALLARRRHSR
jgi:WD40 repeat protein